MKRCIKCQRMTECRPGRPPVCVDAEDCAEELRACEALRQALWAYMANRSRPDPWARAGRVPHEAGERAIGDGRAVTGQVHRKPGAK